MKGKKAYKKEKEEERRTQENPGERDRKEHRENVTDDELVILTMSSFLLYLFLFNISSLNTSINETFGPQISLTVCFKIPKSDYRI